MLGKINGKNGVQFLVIKKLKNKISDFREVSVRNAYIRIHAKLFNMSCDMYMHERKKQKVK